MNETKTYSILNLKSFFYRFILILLAIQLLDNILIFLSLNTIIHKPRIPQFRLICSICQILVFIIFIVCLKPSIKDLGLTWFDMKKSSKIIYLVGGLLVLSLVVSSYFIMSDRKYFALMTNIHFGLTTPIFEELIFRGYGWEKFRNENHSNLVTLMITSLTFALFHLGYYYQISYATQFHPDAPSMINIMFMKIIFAIVLGFIMGLIRWKTKRVFGPVIIHSILNIMGH